MANNYKVKIIDLQNKYKFKIFAISSNTVMKNEIDALYQAWPKESGTGTDVNLTGVIAAPMNIDLKGNTSQDGTPTPSLPIPVNVVSGNNTINICADNLFTSTPSGAGECLTSTGTIVSGSENLRYTTNYIEIPSNASKLYISGILSTALMNTPAICFYDNNKTFISGEAYNNRNDFYINIPSNAKYLRTSYRSVYTNFFIAIGNTYPIYLGGNVFKLSEIEQNKAIVGATGVINNSSVSNVSGYIPVIESLTYRLTFDYTTLLNETDRGICYYDKNMTFINGGNLSMTNKNQLIAIPSGIRYIKFSYDKNLTDINFSTDTTPIELCKIGTYQDYIYKDNGSWYLHKEIGKKVLDGSEDWTLNIQSTYVNQYLLSGTNLSDDVASGTSFIMSDYFKYEQGNPSSTTNEDYMWLYQKKLVLDVRKTIVSDASGLKTWVANNKPTFYYLLATPTNTLIEDTTLIEQLEALRNAESYKGQTNISQVNDDEAFIISASALKDLSNL